MRSTAAQSARGKLFALVIVVAVFAVGLGLGAYAIHVALTGGTPPSKTTPGQLP